MGKLKDDERFKNVDYHHTDLKKTFARVRAQQREAEKAQAAAEEQAALEKEAEEQEKVNRLYRVYPGLRNSLRVAK